MIYWFIISSLIYPVTSSLNEVNELKGWEWHTSQLIDRASAVNLGISIAVSSGSDFEKIAKRTLLSAVIYWTIYDFVLSRYGYKDSDNFFDRISIIKIPLLAGMICLNIF